jgi:hypothetical protein
MIVGNVWVRAVRAKQGFFTGLFVNTGKLQNP